jgi:hypothetical protein
MNLRVVCFLQLSFLVRKHIEELLRLHFRCVDWETLLKDMFRTFCISLYACTFVLFRSWGGDNVYFVDVINLNSGFVLWLTLPTDHTNTPNSSWGPNKISLLWHFMLSYCTDDNKCSEFFIILPWLLTSRIFRLSFYFEETRVHRIHDEICLELCKGMFLSYIV